MQRELAALRLELHELRASRERLALAADADRRDIERALHDGLQQQLVGLAADLELAAGSLDADPETAAALLAEMRRDVRGAIEEARTLAHGVYPPLLDAGGLDAALRSAAVDADVRSRIDVAVGTDVPSHVASVVFRCFLDALERADPGTPVAVTVREEEGALVFEIVADRDVDAAFPVHELVEALGGRLSIGSGPGRRTSVAGSLPVP